LSVATVVVLKCGNKMAATLSADVVEPGVVCDMINTTEPVCTVVSAPAFNASGVVELHPHADPDTWLLENPDWLPGRAYRWCRDELGSESASYKSLNALALQTPAGSDGVVWVPTLAGAMAPEWNPRARAGWYGVTTTHGRPHLVRSLLKRNALALRDVL